jgi:hypothetical protein
MANQGIAQRISPLWLGIGISGSLLLIMFVVETVTGRWSGLLIGGEFDPLASVSEGMLRDVRIAIVLCLVAGYLPAALLSVLRSGRRTVLVLQGTLDCTPRECEALAASIRLSTRGLVVTGLAGLILALTTPYMVPPVPETPWNPLTWSPEVAWHRILGPVVMVWGAWLVYAIVTVSVRMSRIAKKMCKIDLLDLSPLAPFTQQGLTNALVIIGSLSVWSLMMIETGFGQMLLIIGGGTLIGTVFALVSPVHGVHVRICQSKERELGWVNSEISTQQDLFHGSETSHPSGRMADLIAYRGLVENVPEWPFTINTYSRILLYVLLPVATWGIGLIAELLVDRAFQ